MKLKEKMDIIENLEKRISANPLNFRELNAELSELKKDVEAQIKGMLEVTEEEKKEYTTKFERGEGDPRDETCAYFERENKYPIRVEKFDEDGGVYYYVVDSVPFTGY